MEKKKYTYIELVRISNTETIERIETSHMSDKNHLKALNSIKCNEEVFRIDEYLSDNIHYDEIGKDKDSIILKHLLQNKEIYKYES